MMQNTLNVHFLSNEQDLIHSIIYYATAAYEFNDIASIHLSQIGLHD